jgi:hypothetical protein
MSINVKTTATIPTYCIGLPGDTANTIAADATGFYYSTKDYDGTSAIWYRIPFTTLPFPPPPAPPPGIPTLTIRTETSTKSTTSQGSTISRTSKTVYWNTTDATTVTINGERVSANGNRVFNSTSVATTIVLQFSVVGPVGTVTRSYTLSIPATSTTTTKKEVPRGK